MSQQLSLFPSTKLVAPVEYYPDFLTQQQADLLFTACKQLSWQQNKIKMLGKWIDLPRLETMHGDKPYVYTYSGSVELKATDWTTELLELKVAIESACFYQFNLVIGNFYRSGADHIGWHSDSNSNMGSSPAIASVSLGATRRFQLKPKRQEQSPTEYKLTHGSLILMKPGCQENWVHRIVKTSSPSGERINLTYRPHV